MREMSIGCLSDMPQGTKPTTHAGALTGMQPQTSGSPDNAQPTEPHQPGQGLLLKHPEYDWIT